MSSFYLKMAATAERLITKFGFEVTIKREIGGATHPVTGVVSHGLTDTYQAVAVLGKYPDDSIDGTRILQSDRKLTMSSDTEPMINDMPLINGEYWNIVGGIETVKPDGATPIVYFVQVRR